MAGLVTLLIGSGMTWFFLLEMPDIRSAEDYKPQVATLVLDRRGKQIDAIHKQYRLVRPLSQMPKLLPLAFVAAEDSRFYEHSGLDGWSILRAAINNIRTGKKSQGGSTITQQVTRSLLLTRQKTYIRKLTESLLAYRLNKMLSKNDILFLYLNEIYLGEGAYGVDAAARVYFGKSVSSLNLAEIAILAGLPQSPGRYSPLRNPKAAKARQRYVLNRMAEENIISAATARWAYKKPLHYAKTRTMKANNGYFTSYIRRKLTQKFGSEELFYQGLVVTTTLDSRLQAAAAASVRQGVSAVAGRQGKKTGPQGALVSIESTSGRIRAMVGGTDYRKSQFNRVVDAHRQPGSVFKPLIYATAFEQGLSATMRLDDQPLNIRNNDGTYWRPQNYDKTFQGPTTLADALIHSRNIVAIKLLQKTGLKPVIALARKAGISSRLEPDLTLALGSSPVSLLEMTASYQIFVNQGRYNKPVAITSIKDRSGKRTVWPQPRARQIISKKSSYAVQEIMKRAVRQGTGRQASSIHEAAGKTGTTSNNTDAWFIGSSKHLTTGVWVGHDRNQPLGKGETGGRAAAPIWKSFMEKAL